MSGGGKRQSPPEHSRFRKGQSGNPKGRPRKAKETRTRDIASAFDIVLDRKLSVTHDGVARELTVEEALQWKTYQDALAGSRLAQRQVFRMIEKREAALAAKAGGKPARRTKLQLEYKTPRTADEALVLLGIIGPDKTSVHTDRFPATMLIEPWAVQMALGRLRGVERLTHEQINGIRGKTREGDTIRWPRGIEK